MDKKNGLNYDGNAVLDAFLTNPLTSSLLSSLDDRLSECLGSDEKYERVTWSAAEALFGVVRDHIDRLDFPAIVRGPVACPLGRALAALVALYDGLTISRAYPSREDYLARKRAVVMVVRGLIGSIRLEIQRRLAEQLATESASSESANAVSEDKPSMPWIPATSFVDLSVAIGEDESDSKLAFLYAITRTKDQLPKIVDARPAHTSEPHQYDPAVHERATHKALMDLIRALVAWGDGELENWEAKRTDTALVERTAEEMADFVFAVAAGPIDAMRSQLVSRYGSVGPELLSSLDTACREWLSTLLRGPGLTFPSEDYPRYRKVREKARDLLTAQVLTTMKSEAKGESDRESQADSKANKAVHSPERIEKFHKGLIEIFDRGRRIEIPAKGLDKEGVGPAVRDLLGLAYALASLYGNKIDGDPFVVEDCEFWVIETILGHENDGAGYIAGTIDMARDWLGRPRGWLVGRGLDDLRLAREFSERCKACWKLLTPFPFSESKPIVDEIPGPSGVCNMSTTGVTEADFLAAKAFHDKMESCFKPFGGFKFTLPMSRRITLDEFGEVLRNATGTTLRNSLSAMQAAFHYMSLYRYELKDADNDHVKSYLSCIRTNAGAIVHALGLTEGSAKEAEVRQWLSQRYDLKCIDDIINFAKGWRPDNKPEVDFVLASSLRPLVEACIASERTPEPANG